MGLFKRRPLCLFCTLFLISSVLMIHIEIDLKLLLAAVICTVILVLTVTRIILKRAGIAFLTVILCLLSILLGVVNFAFRIDLKAKSAEKFIGEKQITANITDVSYASSRSSVYVADIEQINGEPTSVKVMLVCGFKCELDVGDRVISKADIMKMTDVAMGRRGQQRNSDKDVLLAAVINEPDDGQIYRFDRELPFMTKLFSKNGYSVVMDEISDFLSIRSNTLVGEEHGTVMTAFLLGKTSDVSANILRDFRRSGVSHLFAVSGLHISVLLGAVELTLRRLLTPKYVRCGVISVLALVLLALTGFSMSALRAVIMLWIVYLAFVFSEETGAWISFTV